MNKLEKARKKHNLLVEAHSRVSTLIIQYSPKLIAWDENYNWDFNLLHDLHDRIEDRIFDARAEYNQIHFNNHGWVAI